MIGSLMVVDDSATMRKIMARIVSMAGIEVGCLQEAANGDEALEILRQKRVDVILCDINMPKMSGACLVKTIRRELPDCNDTKIIMVSAESCPEQISHVMANGADGYITKPFTPERFQQELAKCVLV